MKKFEVCATIYEAMGDSISKNMYKSRIDYSNGINEAMESIILSVGGIKLIDFLQKNADDIYIFGAGILGEVMVDTWGWKYKFKAFIDNDIAKQGKKIGGVPIISLDEVLNRKNASIIVVNKFHWKEIMVQLLREGFQREKIFNLGEIYRQFNANQYFDLEYLEIQDGEQFVDCGALDGETSLNLLKRYGNLISKVWLFEPDKRNVRKVIENFKEEEVNYEIIEKGAWSSSTTLRFNSLGNGGASIDENGADSIETATIDEVLGDNVPTFIKMDIEGAELEALKGAEKSIRNHHPKLAISIYHKPEDIEEIPKLLLNYYSGYTFYLRHYSLMNSETILYAI